MTKAKLELAFSVLFIALGILGFLEALRYRGQSGLMPQAVMVIATLLALVWFVQAALSLQRDTGVPIRFTLTSIIRFAATVGGTVLVVIGITRIGFFTSAAVAVPAIAYVLGYRSAWGLAVGTVLFVAVLFAVFHLLLRIPLPPEVLLRSIR